MPFTKFHYSFNAENKLQYVKSESSLKEIQGLLSPLVIMHPSTGVRAGARPVSMLYVHSVSITNLIEHL